MTLQDSGCIFCKIVSGQIPARVIMENEKAMAFLDAFPIALGHALVVPRSHFQKIQDMEAADVQAVFELVHKVTGRIESAAGASASTIAIHNGKEAGQEVPHVHVHVIPRKPDDGAGPVHSMFKKRPKLSSKEMDALLGKVTMMPK